ncbi:MAG: 50S ribosomal protein L4 [Candidatus Omnitrophota bacterium]|jgi:large subunit ribosomal protein L4
MKAPLYSKDGHKKKEIVLNPKIYAARVNVRLLELVRNAYSANLRHGTADTKTRKEVRGGGKKPWKQKGTGRARHGSSRSPIWVGGGITFGPHPRSYYVNLSKSMRRQALISALSLRGAEKKLTVVEDLKVENPKTKEWVQILNALHVKGKKALCVVKEMAPSLKRASSNMSRMVTVTTARDLNAYHVLLRDRILLEEEALPVIEARVLEGKETPAS